MNFEFKHRGNNRSAKLILVPKCKNKASFFKIKQTIKWLEDLVDSVATKNDESVDRRNEAAMWILECLGKKLRRRILFCSEEAGVRKF